MGKKAKARRASTAPPENVEHPLRSGPNLPLLILSGLGAALTGYMAWTALGGGSVRGCGIGSSCDIVLNSNWSKLFGLPTALWGFFAYAALGYTAFEKRVDRHWQYAWTLSLFGLLFSLYLTTISLTVIGAACPYCLTSLALMTSTFVLLTFQRPGEIPNFAWRGWLAKTAPASLGLILVLHLSFTGVIGTPAPPDNPIAKALAEHLTDIGAKMYGASWCPHCQEQKRIFGSAARYLPYVECSPDGQGTVQAEVCRAQNIESYPTWVVNGGRREEVLSLDELVRVSGFKLPQATESTSSN